VFIGYNWELIKPISLITLMNIFRFGIGLDLSVSSYLTLFLFLFYVIYMLIQHKSLIYIIKLFSIFFILILALLTCADAVVYKHWSVKINPAAISFLSSPREVIASVGNDDHVLIISVIGILFFYVLYRLLLFVSDFLFNYPVKNKIWHNIVAVLMFPLLIIGIRGGLQLEPINQSSAFFSDRTICNHAALNTAWNLLDKYTLKKRDHSIYGASPEAQLMTTIRSFYDKTPSETLLMKIKKPNIVLIILEGFTADVISAFGGLNGYTPNLDSISGQSIIWTNFYANGDRTYKGLPAILNGWPTRPVGSVTQDADQTQTLPSIAKVLKSEGYDISFYYGGESEFANIKSYLINTGFDKIIDINDFPASLQGKKWGVADHYVFDKLAHDLNVKRKPFFNSILTLSSHEPYDIPLEPFVKGDNPKSKFLNTVMYTDYSIGKFFSVIKDYSWFDSTLFVITADHGNHLPVNYTTNYEPGRFKIPMLLYGNMIPDSLRGSFMTNISSQNDIAFSVLNQLRLPAANFEYSQNMFDSGRGTAFYTFDHGFGLITKGSKFCYDYNSNKIIYKEGNANDSLLTLGKMIMEATQKK